MNDGTQERTLDPPDNSLSDAEMRACKKAASDGFDAMDERARKWLRNELADTPKDIARFVLHGMESPFEKDRSSAAVALMVLRMRIHDRYIAECAEEYWGDLIEQEKYAQEDR